MLSTREGLRTERLVLRALEPGDLDDVAALQSDPGTIRYLPWPLRTREESALWLADRIQSHALEHDGDAVAWAAVRRDDGGFVGVVVLFLRSTEHRTTEVGFVLSPSARGAGYASEAAHALVQLSFDRLDAHRVVARLDPRNDASARVLARLGMTFEGVHRQDALIRGQWSDTAVWAVLRQEWPG